MTLVWLHLTTDHFEFDAFGPTEDDAHAFLVAGLEEHGKQYRCAPQWWDEYIEDVQVIRARFPGCMRDRDENLL
jgi:hypothetical protein